MPSQAEIVEILSGIFPADAILTSREDLVPYSFDATAMLQQMPAAVAFGRTVDEVSRLLKAANERGLVIVPRGSGTGLSGGVMPALGGVVISLDVNRVIEVDSRNLTLLRRPAPPLFRRRSRGQPGCFIRLIQDP
jgi:glycolate oxidase